MRIFIIIAVAVLSFTPMAFAHPPTDIVISVSGNTVNIAVMHDVSDPLKHYIYNIEVSLNGKEMIKQGFLAQTDGQGQKAIYIIPSLKAGDKISVDADCNMGGDLTKAITVS